MKRKDVRGKKQLYCVTCNCVCGETVCVRRTVSRFYFYCDKCGSKEKNAVRVNTKEFLAAQQLPTKKAAKPKKKVTKNKCGVCAVICTDTIFVRDWGGTTYYYCHNCKHHDSKAKERPIGLKCESCGTPIKQYKLCLHCYKKDRAAARELDRELDRNIGADE